MKKFQIVHACLIFLITSFITASEELKLFNQSFHAPNDAGKALDEFLNSEKVEKFTFNENKSLVSIELKDGSVWEIVLIKYPLCRRYFFSTKKNFEIMKSRTSLDDLGSGNF